MSLSKPWEISVRDFILVVYLLVLPDRNFCKRLTPCQIIFKVYDTSLDNHFVEHILAASG